MKFKFNSLLFLFAKSGNSNNWIDNLCLINLRNFVLCRIERILCINISLVALKITGGTIKEISHEKLMRLMLYLSGMGCMHIFVNFIFIISLEALPLLIFKVWGFQIFHLLENILMFILSFNRVGTQ